MSTILEGNYQTFVIDEESRALRELAERSQGSSPTQRAAADHSDNEGVERSQAFGDDEWVSLSEIEGRYVARVLEHTGGNKQAAARILAVDRKTLDRMIKRHHIDCPSHRRRIPV